MPGLGWGMVFLKMIFVKRNWDSDKERIMATFQTLRDSGIPVWLTSFLEGTRITPEKAKESVEFAKERGLPQFKHVMVPRTKGFVAMIKGLRGSQIEYVYDFTYGYLDGVFSFQDFLGKNLRGVKLCINVRRIPIASLPEDDVELANWCISAFERKEKLLRELATNKSTKRRFVGEAVQSEPLLLEDWYIRILYSKLFKANNTMAKSTGKQETEIIGC